jgi:hypothetical protein
MDIKQLSVQYLQDHDRILMRFITKQGPQPSLWLTRAMVRRWWPALREGLATLEASQPMAFAQPVTNQEMQRDICAELERAEVADEGVAGPPSHQEMPSGPHGADPLLVTEVTQTTLPTQLALAFKEKLAGLQDGRGLNLELDTLLLQGMVQLLELALKQTDWGLVAKALPVEATPDQPSSDGHRYLH